MIKSEISSSIMISESQWVLMYFEKIGIVLKSEKYVISNNMGRTLKGCSLVVVVVNKIGSSHISAEVVQSQVVNVEEALESIKLEISDQFDTKGT